MLAPENPENRLPHEAVKVASRRLRSATASEHEAAGPNARLPPCERAQIPPELLRFFLFCARGPSCDQLPELCSGFISCEF